MPGERGTIVNVMTRGQQDYALPVQIAPRIGESMWARPADVVKRVNKSRPPPQADEPIAAIVRRAEHGIAMPERPKRARDVVARDMWHIAADDHHRPRRESARDRCHAVAEIAGSLLHDALPRRPLPRPVGRHRQPSQPTAVGQAAQRMREHDALNAQGVDRADVPRQTPFAGSEPRLAREDHEVTLQSHGQP